MNLMSAAFHAAHDLGLAAWFGGAYMGAIALNGASREIDDPTQRSRVANAGWFRWAAVVPFAVGLHLTGAAGLTRQSGCNEGDTGVSRLRAVVTIAAMLATLETGRSGRQATREGDVPVATAVIPIADTPKSVAKAMRRLRVMQWVVPSLTASLVIIDAAQQQAGGTRLLPGLACRLPLR